jgi:hypothetical protein
MEKPKLPKKGGGEALRKIYEENRKKSKPSPELLDILKQQKIDEETDQKKYPAAAKDMEV